jgi:hypothetical protein
MAGETCTRGEDVFLVMDKLNLSIIVKRKLFGSHGMRGGGWEGAQVCQRTGGGGSRTTDPALLNITRRNFGRKEGNEGTYTPRARQSKIGCCITRSNCP